MKKYVLALVTQQVVVFAKEQEVVCLSRKFFLPRVVKNRVPFRNRNVFAVYNEVGREQSSEFCTCGTEVKSRIVVIIQRKRTLAVPKRRIP